MQGEISHEGAVVHRLFGAGILAGFLQALIVSALAVAATRRLGIDQFLPVETDAATGAMGINYAALIAWCDILIAVCLSMIRTRQVEVTALRLRNGFRRVSPRDPARAASSLLVQLSLASISFAVLATRAPPAFVLSIGSTLGSAGYGALVWPAIMSIGVAAFGANAHAALLGGDQYPS
jgi:hypothetical protein